MSIGQAKNAVHRYGIYCGVRYLRNKGVPFEYAYFAAFNRFPTR